MTHQFLSHPFGCLRAFACAVVLSFAASVIALPTVHAQDAPAENVTPEDAPDTAAPEESAPEEAAAEEAEPEQAEPEGEAEDSPAQETPPEEKKPWDVSRPCENYQHPYEADLCQQWRTAEAAEKTAAATERTVGLTRLLMLIAALATLLLLLMFAPLVMAALAARRAAQGGAPAPAVVADREEELRAYVDVDKLEFIETPESEGIVKVKVIFRNTGQTPAFNTKTASQVGVRDVADEDMLPVMPLPDRARNPARPRIGRDATAVDIIQCDSTPSLADRVMNGDATILVWGFVEYLDVFDRRRKTTFQYLCNADTLDTGQIFKPMIRGDEDG